MPPVELVRRVYRADWIVTSGSHIPTIWAKAEAGVTLPTWGGYQAGGEVGRCDLAPDSGSGKGGWTGGLLLRGQLADPPIWGAAWPSTLPGGTQDPGGRS